MPDRRTLKKIATHRALATAARELTLERGLGTVTVEDIADAAGVSPRTFFNYFSSKEEAVVGFEPAVLAALAAEVEGRPLEEDPLTALLAVLAPGPGSDLARRWRLRTELVGRHPELAPRYLAGLADLERALTAAVAARLCVDAAADPYPGLLVAAAIAALRTTLEWWVHTGSSGSLTGAFREAFDVLASGLSRSATS